MYHSTLPGDSFAMLVGRVQLMPHAPARLAAVHNEAPWLALQDGREPTPLGPKTDSHNQALARPLFSISVAISLGGIHRGRPFKGAPASPEALLHAKAAVTP